MVPVGLRFKRLVNMGLLHFPDDGGFRYLAKKDTSFSRETIDLKRFEFSFR
jgi:hypothetical protein